MKRIRMPIAMQVVWIVWAAILTYCGSKHPEFLELLLDTLELFLEFYVVA